MEASAVKRLGEEGIPHLRVNFRASSVNPFSEFLGFGSLYMTLRSLRPDIVHCASPKGLMYGGIAARLAGVPALVLAVSGMGYAFTHAAGSWKRRVVRRLYIAGVRLAYGHRNKRVIVQNRDDKLAVESLGFASASELVVIGGSGVELERFDYITPSAKQKIVLFPARLLVDKGLLEFVEAARSLRGRVPGWRFLLAGAADYDNPSGVSEEMVKGWCREGVVEWLGHVDDMVDMYGRASIVCLPSYREGMPKSLLEAAAAGCAVVTTDAVGCREAVVPGETGDLVPIADAGATARALFELITDGERRIRYAECGRARAYGSFGIDQVVKQTIAAYADILGS